MGISSLVAGACDHALTGVHCRLRSVLFDDDGIPEHSDLFDLDLDGVAPLRNCGGFLAPTNACWRSHHQHVARHQVVELRSVRAVPLARQLAMWVIKRRHAARNTTACPSTATSPDRETAGSTGTSRAVRLMAANGFAVIGDTEGLPVGPGQCRRGCLTGGMIEGRLTERLPHLSVAAQARGRSLS